MDDWSSAMHVNNASAGMNWSHSVKFSRWVVGLQPKMFYSARVESRVHRLFELRFCWMVQVSGTLHRMVCASTAKKITAAVPAQEPLAWFRSAES